MEITIQENSQYGLVVSSRVVAEELGKRHTEVLRALKGILTNANLRSLIIESNYKDKKGEMRKEYLLTKDGFTLYMFNIQGYIDFKMAYINKFNEMEKELNSIKMLKYGELEELQVSSMKDFKFIYSSLECAFMLLSKTNEEIVKIEKAIARMRDHQVHAYLYTKQSEKALKQLQQSLNML
ncbi:MAG: Rha family transcriptional regulator [Fusobacterium sp.]|uniref:Rha family transcriptional regulator n=1 Tax=Fusobacterium sp. TaxID=68766 RepID=UPI0039920BAD